MTHLGSCFSPSIWYVLWFLFASSSATFSHELTLLVGVFQVIYCSGYALTPDVVISIPSGFASQHPHLLFSLRLDVGFFSARSLVRYHYTTHYLPPQRNPRRLSLNVLLAKVPSQLPRILTTSSSPVGCHSPSMGARRGG